MLDDALWFSDDWTLTEDLLRVVDPASGVLFTTSNGYVGTRGRRREPFGDGGLVLVAGCHETRPYAHPERSFGVPEHSQTMVAVTDPTPLSVLVDGISMAPDSGTWLEHQRSLDLRTGCVSTAGTWRSPSGVTVVVRSRRMASLDQPALLWTTLELEARDGTAAVEVVMDLAANTSDRTFPDEPEALSRAWGRVFRPAGTLADGTRVGLVHTTALSGRAVACVADIDGGVADADVVVDEDRARRTIRATIGAERVLSVCQRAAFADGPAEASGDVLRDAAAAVTAAHEVTFDDALARQRVVLDDFWAAGDVELDGAPEVERAVRFSTFQVFQATACCGHRPTSAKGLSGQGYEGHQLWEQEIYVGQLLSVLSPAAARAALSFRCATLPQARERAHQLSHRGAQYPWRTIDGREASAFFPAGAAQHHLNADIAWAIEHYVACTGDASLLSDGGVEVLVETARFWMTIGRFDDEGAFRIDGVTGPDEYTALVDNNLYTNLMAAANLDAAADRVDALAAADPAAFRALAAGVGLGPGEPTAWRRAAGHVLITYDDQRGIHAQDEGFLRRQPWDLAATPPEQFPLQDHHHLLTLYRRQVLKQADVVLAQLLLPDRFTPEQRRRNFDYYEPLTAHDSSLSAPVHAIVAADVGHLDTAWRYTRDTVLTDLDDAKGSLRDGLHIAASAGAWLAVACGFGGFRVRDGCPRFRPQLPPGVHRCCFRLRFRGSLLEVATDADGTTYRVVAGGDATVLHGDEPVHVPADGSVRRPPVA